MCSLLLPSPSSRVQVFLLIPAATAHLSSSEENQVWLTLLPATSIITGLLLLATSLRVLLRRGTGAGGVGDVSSSATTIALDSRAFYRWKEGAAASPTTARAPQAQAQTPPEQPGPLFRAFRDYRQQAGSGSSVPAAEHPPTPALFLRAVVGVVILFSLIMSYLTYFHTGNDGFPVSVEVSETWAKMAGRITWSLWTPSIVLSGVYMYL